MTRTSTLDPKSGQTSTSAPKSAKPATTKRKVFRESKKSAIMQRKQPSAPAKKAAAPAATMGWATGLEGKSYPKKPRGHEIDALELFRASPTERIALIKSGVPATAAKRLFAGLDIAQRDTLRALDLPVATINKMAKAARRLDPAASERVLGIARLVGQVQAMVEESGNPDGFDAAEWVSRWLREPVAALGGKRPLDLLDTMEGQSLVSQALARMQTGAYS